MDKTCTKCGEEKDLSEFYVCGGGKVLSQCKECHRRHNYEWRTNNKGKYRKDNKGRHRSLRMDVLKHYGGDPPKCSCVGCPNHDFEFLAIDHVGGGGNKHRRELGGGTRKVYPWIKRNNYPSGFRVLCHNCNASIGAYGYCPHERRIS